jgi:hypothetical protein
LLQQLFWGDRREAVGEPKPAGRALACAKGNAL